MSHAALNTETASFESFHQPNIQKLHHVFHDTEDWLTRAGKSGIRKFFFGLLRGIEDENVIRRLIILLSSASQKDYVYTRSRSNPGLPADAATKSIHKGFSSKLIKDCAAKTLAWFHDADEHCKITFILFIAKLCVDTGIAHQACNLCKTILQMRKAKLISKHTTNNLDVDQLDALSLDSSRFSYHTDDHPELYDLATVLPNYGNVDISGNESVQSYFSSPTSIKRKDNARNVIEDGITAGISEFEQADSQVCMIPTSYSALSGVSPHCDFIGLLPVHLSKNILGMLSKKDLSSCALVHSSWYQLVSQVRSDEYSLQIIKEEAILMQGISAKGSNPTHANIRRVLVPVVDEITQNLKKRETDFQATTTKVDGEEELFESIFLGLETKYVDVEERNMYCGAYNLLVLDQRSNSNRVIGYAGEDNLVIGSTDKVIRTVDISSGREKSPKMQGHPASITGLFMGTKEQGMVISGGYDTTIRKWNINAGYCQMILHGHRSSVTCLDLSGDLLVSGSLDGLVKVWNIAGGVCVCTFRHSRKFSVTCVQIQNQTIVSSCEKGLVKVWSLKSRRIVKILNNHGGMKVNCVRFDKNFLLSGGSDDYLLLWSMPGRNKICLKAYRHPKPVLCLEFRYMCAISGCADGKIRVINIFTGDCLRVLRGNSLCDPIMNIFATEDRLLVNTSSNCLVMHFEPVEWEYQHPSVKAKKGTRKQWETLSKRPVSSTILHAVSRAKKFSLASASDKRIYNRTCSAPPAAFKKLTADPVSHSYVKGQRPASHYIDLQPEFRRPRTARSGMTTSVISAHPDSLLAANPSNSPSRLVSAASTRRTVSVRGSGASPSNIASPSHKVWPMGNKHTQLARDGILMRVGMLNNARKKEEHNINTELNSISYFDRHYPRGGTARGSSAAVSYRSTSAAPQKMKYSVGKFTSEEEEIREIKSVLREGNSPEDFPRKRTVTYSEPILDPLRLGFTFIKSTQELTQANKDALPGLHIDHFMYQQLGVSGESDDIDSKSSYREGNSPSSSLKYAKKYPSEQMYFNNNRNQPHSSLVPKFVPKLTSDQFQFWRGIRDRPIHL